MLYREAFALGLDKNYTIVKRRLAQKMAFLAEDVAAIGQPKREELESWFEKNLQRFALPPRVSFRHVYFSPDRRAARASDDAGRALEKLAGKPTDAPITKSIGDPFMFQEYYGDRTLEQVVGVFGTTFAQSLFGLKPRKWQGPVGSGLRWHLVFIDDLTPARVPAFEEAELEVKQEWIADRRTEAKRKAFEAMRARYDVVLPAALQDRPRATR